MTRPVAGATRGVGVCLPMLTALGFFFAGPLAAQQSVAADSGAAAPGATTQTMPGLLIDRLPVDRVQDVLRLQPGVNETPDSTLSIRGGEGGDFVTYIDGVPVTPGLRALDAAALGGARSGTAFPGTNALDDATVWTGPMPAALGHAQTGAVLLTTHQPEAGWRPSLAYASDGLFGNSLGFNRAQGSIGGTLGRIEIFGAAVLEGQKSAVTGFDAVGAPIFVQAGIDTTVAVPSALGNPSADTAQVPIYNFAVGRGSCDQFSGSADPGIADNFGVTCRTARTPESTTSSYQWLATARLPLGQAGGIELLAIQDQHQQRDFDYPNLYNPNQQFGERRAGAVYGLVFQHRFARRGRSAMQLDAYLSAQHERTVTGPLTEAGASSSSDPFGGFLITPLDFRYDFSTFPITDQLIRNVQINEPGTVRTPYDLENRDQYNLVDQYRNNAYGLQGFSESGGPVGLLRLAHEHRWVAGANLGWAVGHTQFVSIGGEMTRHEIELYRSGLTSQAFSDAYHERPVQQSLWLEDRLTSGAATLALGLRYDRFDSRASRPVFLDPATGDSAYFPRISSAPGFDPTDPTATFVRDQAHHAWSPRVRLGVRLNPRAEFRLGFSRQAELPDFGDIYSGINTDLGITNTGAVWGSDLGFQHTDLLEAGIQAADRHRHDARLRGIPAQRAGRHGGGPRERVRSAAKPAAEPALFRRQAARPSARAGRPAGRADGAAAHRTGLLLIPECHGPGELNRISRRSPAERTGPAAAGRPAAHTRDDAGVLPPHRPDRHSIEWTARRAGRVCDIPPRGGDAVSGVRQHRSGSADRLRQ